MEATYTDLRKFCGKNGAAEIKKILLLFITENTIRVFSAFTKFVGCPKQFPSLDLKIFTLYGFFFNKSILIQKSTKYKAWRSNDPASKQPKVQTTQIQKNLSKPITSALQCEL